MPLSAVASYPCSRFSPQPLVVDAYVVEAEGGELTDLVSFYTLPSTVLGHPEHKELRAAYMFYTGGVGRGQGGAMWVNRCGDHGCKCANSRDGVRERPGVPNKFTGMGIMGAKWVNLHED